MGQQLIETFLHKCAGSATTGMPPASSRIRSRRSARRSATQVICGLSGGVHSAVAAALVHKAIGDQLTCVFVDHGLLRKGEAEQVKHDFVEATGIKLIAVDASEDFLTALKGVGGRRRKIIGGKVRSHVREGSAPDHRRGGCFRKASQVPGSGHPLPGCCGIRRWRRRSQHQVAPQCGWPAGRHQVPARRATAYLV